MAAVGFMVEAGAEDIECSHFRKKLAYYVADHGLVTDKNTMVAKATYLHIGRRLASLTIPYVKKSHAIIAASSILSRYRQFLRVPRKPILSVILPGSRTHIIHLVMLAGLLLSSISDTNASVTATSVPNNEVTSSISE